MKAYLEFADIVLMEEATTNLRDRLLVRILFRLGCRISEALALKVEDIDFDQGMVTIEHLKARIKLCCRKCGARLGRSHKFCPICGDSVEKAVAQEKEHRRVRTLPVDSDTLEALADFIKRDKTRGPIFRINRHRAWQVVRECAERAGLPDLVNPETGRVHGVSPHRLRDAFACASCGYCRSECTEFSAIGWESASPRGKFHFLREYLKGKVELDERMAEMFFVCTTCLNCNEVCQVKIPIEEHWDLVLRPAVWQEGFSPPKPYQIQAHNFVLHHNPEGIPQDMRKAWMPSDIKCKEEGEFLYFAGCAVSFDYGKRNLPINAIRVLNRAGIEPVYLGSNEWCCGGVIYNVGCLDEVWEAVEHNINKFNNAGIKTLITSCPGCYIRLAHYYPIFAQRLNLEYNVRIRHITEIISELIEEGRINCEFPVNLKVTYHDPCHIGRGGGVLEPPRKILASIPGLELVEMPHNRDHSACCGKHDILYPQLTRAINFSRVSEAEQTGAEVIVTGCPTCESNFSMGIPEVGARLEVLDITDLVAKSMGLPVLAVSRLEKLLRSKAAKEQSEIVREKMGVYLTDEELLREENLFAPHEISYKRLEGRTYDIRTLVERVTEGDSMPEAPPSC